MSQPTLEPEKIVVTLERLHQRIEERFPDAGLGRVCDDLVNTARTTAKRARALGAPFVGVRLGVLALIVAGLIAQIAAARYLHLERLGDDVANLVQSTEAAVNLLILFGGAVWFLTTLEERMKRARVLAALHELRSFAHIIDMHQLTKDPTIVLAPKNKRTQHSPARDMTEFELARYLDYCAEMLSLTGKLAALYAERLRDPVVVNAVNDVESLTANLGRKIWQKIMIISQLDETRGTSARSPAT
ncbi:MAG: hypothetical protein HXY28_12880 [Hydrogenophilaceae bacterium]|jgi:hypothetical protein|nr:hypothetical protein [Hydrogenophilaceae bacterium]